MFMDEELFSLLDDDAVSLACCDISPFTMSSFIAGSTINKYMVLYI
jgi:hypothetical protein